MTDGRPFLLARLVTDQLSASPVDTSLPGWQEQVSKSAGEAFDADLASVDQPAGRQMSAEDAGPPLARSLLAALAWAYGAGFPEQEWLAAANALAPEPGFSRDDVLWVLNQLGRYIIQDGEGDVAVYRMAHQSLAEHLRPAFPARHDQLFNPQALPVAQALVARYRTLLDGGIRADEPAYLWRYLWRHVADSGPAGLALLRALAQQDSALRPEVAMAGLEIAARLRHWGRRQDAVAPTEEAVQLRRVQAAGNPAFLPDLAGALTNLGNRYSEVGTPERSDRAWDGVIAEFSGSGKAFLLTARAARTEAGHPVAVRWLSTSLAAAEGDRGLTAAVHEQARRHWAADPPTFSAAWETLTGQPVPAWLTVDAGLLGTATAWIATDTHEQERDFLARHLELLTPAADDAVTEAALSVSEDAAHRYAALRQAARAEGVEAAYRPLLLMLLAQQFTEADLEQQRAMLASQRDDLLSATVRDTIGPQAAEDDAAAHRAAALLDLAALNEHESVLGALADRARLPALLHELACRPSPMALAPAATAALTLPSTPAQAAAALVYLAVAAASTQDANTAVGLLGQARRLAPGQEAQWIGWLADIGQHHPSVLPFIKLLTSPPADTASGEDRGSPGTVETFVMRILFRLRFSVAL